MEEKIDQILEQHLKGTKQPDVFWENIIGFIQMSLRNYAAKLKEKGIDPSLIGSLNKPDESTKDKLNQIKLLLVSLSRLDQTLENLEHKSNSDTENRIKELENALEVKAQKLNEQEDLYKKAQEEVHELKSQFIGYKQEIERKLKLQPKQLKNQLNQDLKLVRDRINMIHEMSVQKTKNDEKGKLQSHLNDAIQTIVNQLAIKELWPEDEKKPDFQELKNDEKPQVKRARRKKSEDKAEVEKLQIKGQDHDVNLEKQTVLNLVEDEKIKDKVFNDIDVLTTVEKLTDSNVNNINENPTVETELLRNNHIKSNSGNRDTQNPVVVNLINQEGNKGNDNE